MASGDTFASAAPKAANARSETKVSSAIRAMTRSGCAAAERSKCASLRRVDVLPEREAFLAERSRVGVLLRLLAAPHLLLV